MKIAQEIRTGNVIMVGNNPMVVLKTEFNKSGRNAAVVKMKLKAFMTGAALALAAAVCLAPAKAEAAPEIMPDGTVFDGEYYAENNPDVVAAMGTDTAALPFCRNRISQNQAG